MNVRAAIHLTFMNVRAYIHECKVYGGPYIHKTLTFMFGHLTFMNITIPYVHECNNYGGTWFQQYGVRRDLRVVAGDGDEMTGGGGRWSAAEEA